MKTGSAAIHDIGKMLIKVKLRLISTFYRNVDCVLKCKYSLVIESRTSVCSPVFVRVYVSTDVRSH